MRRQLATQLSPRLLPRQPIILPRLSRSFSCSRCLRSPQQPIRASTSTHGSELPPRSSARPRTLLQYVCSKEYLFRSLYRSLVVGVIVLPIYFFWHGPIKLGHRDGEWEPFDLVSRDECAESHSYFVLRRKKSERYWWGWYATETSPLETLYSRSPIMSVQIQNPSLQIQRSYTPLNLSSEEIHLVIKRYADGDLSRFLFNLTPGRATVWVKQGRQEWDFRDGDWDHVVFVCAGTGITPAFQLALSALQRQKLKAGEDPNARRTRFTILASAQDAKSILLRQELGTVNHVHGDGLLRVRYFIDRVPKGVKLPEDIQQGPVTEKAIREALSVDRGEKKGWFGFGGGNKGAEGGGKTMVLVCGTDGFTRYVAGVHGGVSGKQGGKGGLLKNINGIEVFKMLESPNDVQPKSVTDSNVGNVA